MSIKSGKMNQLWHSHTLDYKTAHSVEQNKLDTERCFCDSKPRKMK